MALPLFHRLHALDSELERLWAELAELERGFAQLRASPVAASTDYLRAYV